MLNRERFREFIPANGVLKGAVRLSFSGPDGEIRGTGTIKFPPNERPSVSVEVESHSIPPEYHGLLMPFLEGNPPETNGGRTTFSMGSAQKERAAQLVIVTTEGNFRSSSVLIGPSHFDMFGGTNARIDVLPFGLEFSVENPGTEDIWANVAGDELDFGITVSQLLQRFDLKDGDVMERYYSKLSGGTTWEGLLSSIRGEVIHEGAIHVDGRAEIVSWFQFSRHLHDICKRIVLLEIGYKGTYAASNVSWSGTYELDRIKPSTNTEQLGYTLPPTSLR